MRFFAKGLPATLEWYAPARADAASATVQVLNDDGGEIVAAATSATIDSVNTTLATGTAQGSTYVSVVSAASITAGRRYLISSKEMVHVQSVTGTTVNLTTPTWYAHASSATFVGTRLSYGLTATHTATAYDSCVALFSYLVSTVAQPTGRVAFAISNGNPGSQLTVLDLALYDPGLTQKLAGIDGNALIERAWDELTDLVSAKGTPVYDLWGSDEMKRAHMYLTLYLGAEQYGDAFREQRRELWERLQNCLQVLEATAAADPPLEPPGLRSVSQGLRVGP